MKTAIIWDDCEDLKFFLVAENWTRFQGVYFGPEEDEKLPNELVDLVYDEYGQFKHETIDIQALETAIREGARLVKCGQVL